MEVLLVEEDLKKQVSSILEEAHSGYYDPLSKKWEGEKTNFQDRDWDTLAVKKKDFAVTHKKQMKSPLSSQFQLSNAETICFLTIVWWYYNRTQWTIDQF